LPLRFLQSPLITHRNPETPPRLAAKKKLKEHDMTYKLRTFGMMIVCAGFTVLPSVKADEWNKETVVTLNTSGALPGQVLPPGEYVFKLADGQSSRNIVQIFNEDRSHVLAAVLVASASRPEPTGDTVITLEERSNGPEALEGSGSLPAS
jgi:hypothetical protein